VVLKGFYFVIDTNDVPPADQTFECARAGGVRRRRIGAGVDDDDGISRSVPLW
jgi:hypothetical protein